MNHGPASFRTFGRISVALALMISLLAPAVSVRAQLIPVWAPETDTILGGMAAVQTEQSYFDQVLTAVGYAAAKMVIQSLTRSIVNWINSGYDGEPAFSQNLNRDMRQLGDAVAAGFVDDIMDGTFDSPFLAPIAQGAVSAYFLATSKDMLAQRLRYTLMDHTQNSVAYMRGDFSQGGLDAWFQVTSRCGNDPECVSFVTREELMKRVDGYLKKQLADYNAGRGFLSWQGECKEYSISKATNKNKAASLDDKDKCIEYDVLTPGSLVERQIGITTESPLHQLELADSINEIVGAAVTQLVGQVLGPGGLLGASKPSGSGGGRPIDRGIPQVPPFDAAVFTAFTATVRAAQAELTRFISGWTAIKTAAERARSECASDDGDNVDAEEIEEILIAEARSSGELDRAEAAGQDFENLLNFIARVESTTEPTAKAALSLQVQSDYQEFVDSALFIDAEDVAAAVRESTNSGGQPTPLLVRMNQLIDQCD